MGKHNYYLSFLIAVATLTVFVATTLAAPAIAAASTLGLTDDEKAALKESLTSEEIKIPTYKTVKLWPEPKKATGTAGDPCNYPGENTGNTKTTKARIINCVKTVYYKITSWGNIQASLDDFRAKVAETLNSTKGWGQILAFKETKANEKADLEIILSDAAHLAATPGCSAELSCTNWSNQVIINDLRWREGTSASRAAGMSTRDYQHMVINHEVGHWLGHYNHEASCPNGGPAPIMLQQSTGLRGCDSFNAWPLKSELWTLR